MELDLLIKHKENLYGDKPLYTKFKCLKKYKPSFNVYSDYPIPEGVGYKEMLSELSNYSYFNALSNNPSCAIIFHFYDLNCFQLTLTHIGSRNDYDDFEKYVLSVLPDDFILNYRSSLYSLYLNDTDTISLKIRNYSYESVSDLVYSNIKIEQQIAFYKGQLFSTLLGKHYIETKYMIIDPLFLPRLNISLNNRTIIIGDRDNKKEDLDKYGNFNNCPLLKRNYPENDDNDDNDEYSSKYFCIYQLEKLISSLDNCILSGLTSNYYLNNCNKYKNKDRSIKLAESLVQNFKHEEVKYFTSFPFINKAMLSSKCNSIEDCLKNFSIFLDKCRKSPNEMPSIKKRYMNPYDRPEVRNNHKTNLTSLLTINNSRLFKIYALMSKFMISDVLYLIINNIILLDKYNYSGKEFRNTSLYPWLKNQLSNSRVKIYCPLDDNYRSIKSLIDTLYLMSKKTNYSDRVRKSLIVMRDAMIKKYDSIGYTFI